MAFKLDTSGSSGKRSPPPDFAPQDGSLPRKRGSGS